MRKIRIVRPKPRIASDPPSTIDFGAGPVLGVGVRHLVVSSCEQRRLRRRLDAEPHEAVLSSERRRCLGDELRKPTHGPLVAVEPDRQLARRSPGDRKDAGVGAVSAGLRGRPQGPATGTDDNRRVRVAAPAGSGLPSASARDRLAPSAPVVDARSWSVCRALDDADDDRCEGDRDHSQEEQRTCRRERHGCASGQVTSRRATARMFARLLIEMPPAAASVCSSRSSAPTRSTKTSSSDGSATSNRSTSPLWSSAARRTSCGSPPASTRSSVKSSPGRVTLTCGSDREPGPIPVRPSRAGPPGGRSIASDVAGPAAR